MSFNLATGVTFKHWYNTIKTISIFTYKVIKAILVFVKKLIHPSALFEKNNVTSSLSSSNENAQRIEPVLETAPVEDKKSSKFDKIPVPLQALVMLGGLAVVTLAGFGVFFAFDILLLDFDPIGKLVGSHFGN